MYLSIIFVILHIFHQKYYGIFAHERYSYGNRSLTWTHADPRKSRPIIFNKKASAESLKVLGVGLSKTATTSLADFFIHLNLNVIHYDERLTEYLPHEEVFDFRGLYDDVDAIFDIPSAVYYNEILKVYPNSLFISIFRDPQEWYYSFESFLDNKRIYTNGFHPFFLLEMHRFIYGSKEPNHDIWIKNYLKHYENVIKVIPSKQLLQLNLSDIRQNNKIEEKICVFLNISTSTCPKFPISNTAKTSKPYPINFLLNSMSFITPAKSRYAYVTVLGDNELENNKKKVNPMMASLTLCKSIRDTYEDHLHLPYDIVVLLYGYIKQIDLKRLFQCFDRVIPIQPFYPRDPPKGYGIKSMELVSRVKLMSLNLTEYHRIQYIESDYLIISNLDHYFFRSYYESNIITSNVMKPSEMITSSNIDSPISTSYMSFEPCIQCLIDIFFAYIGKPFSETRGWLDYGHFTFEPKLFPFNDNNFLSIEKKYPFLNQISHHHPKPHTMTWKYQDWKFHMSWSDIGIIFYYYFLYKKVGIVLNPKSQEHEMIQFIGRDHQPWIHGLTTNELKSTISSNWKDATTLWLSIYNSIQDMNTSWNDETIYEIQSQQIHNYLFKR